MSTKITVQYIDTGEERVLVWDGELLQAIREYEHRLELWRDAAFVIMDGWNTA